MADFSYIRDVQTRHMTSNGYDAITQLDLWSWLKSYKLEQGVEHENFSKIYEKMELLHPKLVYTESSFHTTMKHMKLIAVNGIEKYKTFMLKNQA